MRVPFLILAPLVVLAALGAYFFTSTPKQESQEYPELAELATDEPRSFQEYATYFRELSKEKGAEYAFDVLLRAEVPPDTDLHLLGHVVGSMLYKEQGIGAIASCTQDFRNACSHSVVIGILTDYGEGSLPTIADTCRKAPGGSGAYTMCFHGLGHGVLAYTEYNLEKTIEMCKKTGTPQYGNREYIECVGGSIMEMIDGVHDPIAWQRQVGNYFKTEDPLYPCSGDLMPPEARAICYDYLTPHLFSVVGGSEYSAETHEAAFKLCDAAPAVEDREACYGGFGKEFIGLAVGRDIRSIGSMSEDGLRKIRAACALAGNPTGEAACNTHALSSLFWGGENLPDASLTFCSLALSKEQGACYAQLAEEIAHYLGGTEQGVRLCKEIPDIYQKGCSRSVL